MAIGKAFLVGAGPGDPRLLTLGAVEALSRADVVLYDHLVHPGALKFSRPGAILRYAGRRHAGAGGARTGMPQRVLERLLVRYARQGLTVVHLKGGDPFLFGRGGEECAALRAAGVPFDVIPGVSSALAVPAAAGIPLTHRGLSSSVVILTGHAAGKPGALPRSGIAWDAVARAGQTIVVLMGAGRARTIARRLMRAGLPASTPIAAVRWGTWPRQKVIAATLGTAGSRFRGLRSPAVLVAGNVVRLRGMIRAIDRRRPTD
jgi:uroporphyrinogen III methyltransferase/synthase